MEKAGLEADDILGTLAKRGEKEGMEVALVSGDRDLLQIASDHIKIRIPKTKGGKTEIEDYYASDVQEAYQVTPVQFIELKALMGDSSDNIPGEMCIRDRLIPVGLHHALNSVFWFDVAGINDLGNFWGNTGTFGQTGMYMTGFFPFMMLGLPAACLAMYHTAKDNKKKMVFGLLASAAFCSFFTGVTEPIEFSFMFLAPGLYLVHALLAGITAAITVALPVRLGFSFSGGAIDAVLSSFLPLAENPWLIIPIAVVVGIIYYVVFRFVITKFNLKTPGREDDDLEAEKKVTLANDDFTTVAKIVLEGLGGKELSLIHI